VLNDIGRHKSRPEIPSRSNLLLGQKTGLPSSHPTRVHGGCTNCGRLLSRTEGCPSSSWCRPIILEEGPVITRCAMQAVSFWNERCAVGHRGTGSLERFRWLKGRVSVVSATGGMGPRTKTIAHSQMVGAATVAGSGKFKVVSLTAKPLQSTSHPGRARAIRSPRRVILRPKAADRRSRAFESS